MTATFTPLRKNLKRDSSGLEAVRIAVLGDCSTQHLVQALQGQAYTAGLRLDVFEADYGQIERQILDPSSDLYQSKPEFVLIVHTAEKLLRRFCTTPPEHRVRFAEEHLATVGRLCEAVTATLPSSRIIYSNLVEIDDGVFGNFANKVDCSFLYCIRQINIGLMDASRRSGNLFIHDTSLLQRSCGFSHAFDARLYVTADMVFSLDFLPMLARHILDIVLALRGKVRKCLILDLDNTIWGGIVGDDGIENLQIGDLGIGKAFTDVQWWARSLKERGILLAACSKNNAETVMEVFRSHPDMVLRTDDFAVMTVNWQNKVDNIRHIQSVLNISLDSMVFVDDSAFERDMVRTFLPEIAVPELPEDPAEYLSYLRSLNLFETASYSSEDLTRTRQYQEESERTTFRANLSSEDDYLQGLLMAATVAQVGSMDVPRVAQLTQRSNQFNLRTVRYSQEDISRLAQSSRHHMLSFRLRDRFGDYGLIGVVILEQDVQPGLFIDTWIMSCRVLKRGMETCMLNHLAGVARQLGFDKLVGEYIRTPKNALVSEHYASLGFSAVGTNYWELDVAGYQERPNHIRTEDLQVRPGSNDYAVG